MNAGRLRGTGDDQEGACSEHRRSRHAGADCLRRQPRYPGSARHSSTRGHSVSCSVNNAKVERTGNARVQAAAWGNARLRGCHPVDVAAPLSHRKSPDRLMCDSAWESSSGSMLVQFGPSLGGTLMKEIVRRAGKSRGLVRQVVRGGRTDVFRSRQCSLDPFLKKLDADWVDGCRNGTALWRRMKAADFVGDLRVVTEWATKSRTATDDCRQLQVT